MNNNICYKCHIEMEVLSAQGRTIVYRCPKCGGRQHGINQAKQRALQIRAARRAKYSGQWRA